MVKNMDETFSSVPSSPIPTLKEHKQVHKISVFVCCAIRFDYGVYSAVIINLEWQKQCI